MEPGEPSDAQLVALCRHGDERAWAQLVDRYSRYVWAIPMRVYRLSESEAEEVFQEVFVRVHRHLDRLRADEAFRSWLAQVTRRLCVDRLRSSQREDLTDELPESPEHDAELERLDDALTVREALGRLPEHCQEVLDRFFARDESYDTIGGALDIPPGTIASRISRCLARLRALLTDDAEPAVTLR
jgi:RNA polymerase sigma-70 factor (ECF subfamily)